MEARGGQEAPSWAAGRGAGPSDPGLCQCPVLLAGLSLPICRMGGQDSALSYGVLGPPLSGLNPALWGAELDTSCGHVSPLILHGESAQDRAGLGSVSA